MYQILFYYAFIYMYILFRLILTTALWGNLQTEELTSHREMEWLVRCRASFWAQAVCSTALQALHCSESRMLHSGKLLSGTITVSKLTVYTEHYYPTNTCTHSYYRLSRGREKSKGSLVSYHHYYYETFLNILTAICKSPWLYLLDKHQEPPVRERLGHMNTPLIGF